MTHLEDIIAEYLDWQGYFVRRNIRVGKRDKGGWNGELDIVAYSHRDHSLLHIEASLDSLSWKKREQRFRQKFDIGRRLIFEEVFQGLDPAGTELEQMAILSAPGGQGKVGGARCMDVDTYIAEICEYISARGVASKEAIPEKYPLLRTVQFIVKGYRKPPWPPEKSGKKFD